MCGARTPSTERRGVHEGSHAASKASAWASACSKSASGQRQRHWMRSLTLYIELGTSTSDTYRSNALTCTSSGLLPCTACSVPAMSSSTACSARSAASCACFPPDMATASALLGFAWGGAALLATAALSASLKLKAAFFSRGAGGACSDAGALSVAI